MSFLPSCFFEPLHYISAPAAISYYHSGCNLLLVSRMLGHSNVATTMRYIGLQQDQMRNTIEAAAQIGLPELDGRENGTGATMFSIC